MTKKFIVLAFFVSAFAVGAGFALAQTEISNVSAVLEAEKVTAADLGVADPGALPTSPLYFLKEWRRGIREFFTFNPLSKAELELRYINEKAAEAEKVAEDSPKNGEAIVKAAENYKAAQERLRARLETLKETSKNPNVGRFLEDLAERSVKHAKLFENLSRKFSGQPPAILAEAADKIAATVAEGFKKDEPVKFAAKIEKVLTEEGGSELKHIRSLEVIDKLSVFAPEAARASLERLREDFSGRLNDNLKTFLQEVGEENLKEAIKALPGDKARRSVILEGVRTKAESRVAEVIKGVNSAIEGAIKEGGDIALRAKEEVAVAGNVLAETKSKITGADLENSLPSAAKKLIKNAEENFKGATEAFSAGDYGEAFGMARSAEILARNVARLIEEKKAASPDNLKEELAGLEAKIEKYGEMLESRGWTAENQPKVYQLFEDTKTHLGFARDEFSKNNFPLVKAHIGHAIGFLTDLSRVIEVSSKLPAAPATPDFVGVPQTMPQKPFVSDCKTVFQKKITELDYSLKAGKISQDDYESKSGSYKEEYKNCRHSVDAVQKSPSIKEPIYCTAQYDPVCGTDGKTYSNDCYAGLVGVKIQYRGECGKKGGLDEFPPTAMPAPTKAVEQSVFYVTVGEDGGFNPSSLKVKKESKVSWVNKSQREVWPASSFHPTHELYPEFDARRGIKPGETYSFVFERAGFWKYHDHLNASMTGVIEVIE